MPPRVAWHLASLLLHQALGSSGPISSTCPAHCSGHGRCKTIVGLARPACVCDRGYTGPACNDVEVACPNNCAGHGWCDGERCICDAGYGGANCGRALSQTCPRECSGHGKCLSHGRCECHSGFGGAACESLVSSLGCAHNCSGRGFCAGGSCVCDAGVSGAGCETVHTERIGCPHNCSGHGTCVHHTGPMPVAAMAAHGAACKCEMGWSGAACEHFDSARQRPGCPLGCSGHGACIHGTCVCDTGFMGIACATLDPAAACPDGCSGRGDCRVAKVAEGPLPGIHLKHTVPYREMAPDGPESGRWLPRPRRRPATCLCHEGSSGPACSIALSVGPGCPSACSGHGLCRDGGCHCEAGFGGDDCGLVCPKGCSGHGRCNDEGVCACEPGWWGPTCSIRSACKNACSLRGECAPSSTLAADVVATAEATTAARKAQAAADAAITSVDAAREFAATAQAAAKALTIRAKEAARPRCHCPRGWGTWGSNASAAAWDDCASPDLSDEGCAVCEHGTCVAGTCRCDHGWSGLHCATDDRGARRAKLEWHGLAGREVPRGA